MDKKLTLGSTSVTLYADNSVMVETLEVTHTLRLHGHSSDSNPLLHVTDNFFYALGVITDDIAATISPFIEGGVEQPHMMIHQSELNKFLIQESLVNELLPEGHMSSYIALQGKEKEDIMLLNLLMVIPHREPVIYENVAVSALLNVWTKIKRDFLEDLKTSLEHKGDSTILEIPDGEDINGLGFNGEAIDVVRNLAGFVLGDSDLEVLIGEIEKEKEKLGPDLIVRRFSVRKNLLGEDIVSVLVANPNDNTGHSVEFIHGDKNQPHGPLGWTVIEYQPTGTEFDKEVRYI